MNINFYEMYVEVGVSFNLHVTVFKAFRKCVREALQGKTIDALVKRFRGKEFALGFVISATEKSDVLTIKGPTFFKKPLGVDFVIRIPYKPCDGIEEVEYVLNHIATGVIQVLERYHLDGTDIARAAQRVIDEVKGNPEAFRDGS